MKTQALSPWFFVFNGGPYVVAQHAAGYSLVGPADLFPGATTPAKPGETVVLYANGFGPTSIPVISGASTQSGTLSPLPVVTTGGVAAKVQYAGLSFPGLYQFNVTIPSNVPGGDNPLVATMNGTPVSPVGLITIAGANPITSITFYVAPNGSDTWSGRLTAPNSDQRGTERQSGSAPYG